LANEIFATNKRRDKRVVNTGHRLYPQAAADAITDLILQALVVWADHGRSQCAGVILCINVSPLRVKSCRAVGRRSCPLYSRKLPRQSLAGMSAKGQERTRALQQSWV